ncbi:MAG: hypothetical protein A2289_05465 [Deltaproteobacteria bacterium RIFOXYA12_FULL_58_15]|nr:MAG: hypothetical protein A2289_05465 [Deltaproteobacteria bacterium RIFOXYA12_FULL_58_15]
MGNGSVAVVAEQESCGAVGDEESPTSVGDWARPLDPVDTIGGGGDSGARRITNRHPHTGAATPITTAARAVLVAFAVLFVQTAVATDTAVDVAFAAVSDPVITGWRVTDVELDVTDTVETVSVLQAVVEIGTGITSRSATVYVGFAIIFLVVDARRKTTDTNAATVYPGLVLVLYVVVAALARCRTYTAAVDAGFILILFAVVASGRACWTHPAAVDASLVLVLGVIVTGTWAIVTNATTVDSRLVLVLHVVVARWACRANASTVDSGLVLVLHVVDTRPHFGAGSATAAAVVANLIFVLRIVAAVVGTGVTKPVVATLFCRAVAVFAAHLDAVPVKLDFASTTIESEPVRTARHEGKACTH